MVAVLVALEFLILVDVFYVSVFKVLTVLTSLLTVVVTSPLLLTFVVKTSLLFKTVLTVVYPELLILV